MGYSILHLKCRNCDHQYAYHGEFAYQDWGGRCRYDKCECLSFEYALAEYSKEPSPITIPDDARTMIIPPKPFQAMTNAQAALIAAACMKKNETTDDVRITAAIFATILDNVDKQEPAGHGNAWTEYL